jgi:hypothetical protein
MQRRRRRPSLSPKEAHSLSSMLESVRIAQYREGFFSALSASLRENREKGKLVAPCRAASFWSIASHQYPPANPASSLKNHAKLPLGSRSNKGQ